MSSDIFQEVSEGEIPKMLQALQKDWPKHFVLFQLVTVMREFEQAGSPLRQTIYIHGDFDNGIYLHKITGKVPTREWTCLYLHTTSASINSLKECLGQTMNIQWESGGFYFQLSDSRFRSAIVEVAASKHLNSNVRPNTLFWYPPSKELNPKNIPDDLSLEFLDDSYADEMNRNWPHKFEGSEFILAENIRRNFALGLLQKSSRRLLCSSLSNYSGGIFVLYTDPEYRGRGYAGLIVENMANEIRKRKRIPFCNIRVGNKASESTFTRAGFELWSDVDFTFISKID